MPRAASLFHVALASFRSILRAACIAVITAAFTAAIASAAPPVKKTWTGNGGDGKWETGGNWNPPGVPANSDTVVIPGNKGTVTTNGGEKTVGTLILEQSHNGPPPPTVLTAKDFPFGSVKITTAGAIYVASGSKIRGEDPTAPNQPGGGCVLKGGAVVIDGSVEGGDASAGSLTSNPGGKVEIKGTQVGSVNGGSVKGGTGSTHTGGGRAGGGGPVEVKGDPIPTGGKFTTEGGAPGVGNPPGKKGTVHINGELQARLVAPAIITGDSVLVVANGPYADVSLTYLPSGSITADDAVAIYSTGTIDLRGNPAGVDVIQAGNSITLCGTVLLDPGVTLESITNPDAVVVSCSGILPVPTNLGLDFALGRPIPNPARGPVRIPFALPHDTAVRLTIHDLRGARVRTLIDGSLPGGTHHAPWDGRDDAGRVVAPGMLFMKLDIGTGSRTRTLLRLR